MRLHVRAKVGDLPAEDFALLAECDTSTELQKFPMRPPSLLRVLVMAPNLLLGCLALFFAAFLVVGDRPGIGLGLAAIGITVERIFGLPGLIAVYRRRHLDRYYVCLHPQGLVERAAKDVTMIPSSRLVRAAAMGYRDSHHHGVLYLDGLGANQTYELKTWYQTEKNLPTDLVEPINAFYRLGERQMTVMFDKNVT